MLERFEGKVAVVVGGNSGIGFAAAKGFANEGGRVFIGGRDPVRLESSVRCIGHGAVGLQVDISKSGEIESFFRTIGDKCGRIDILFVNAGVLTLRRIEHVTEAEWDHTMSINVRGSFFCVQHALPLMRRGSCIVLNGSTAGRKGIAGASVYAASKAAISSLGRSLAAEFVDRGIRVNVLSPGPTDTPIFERVPGLTSEAYKELRKGEIEGVPMKRMGTPEEVAAAVLFLASDAASFITGVDLLAAGGAASF